MVDQKLIRIRVERTDLVLDREVWTTHESMGPKQMDGLEVARIKVNLMH